MTNRNRNLNLISELLQFNFPKAKTVAVTPTTVSDHEQGGGIGIERLAQFKIPGANGRNCKLSRVMTDADTNPGFIFSQIINAVRNGFPFRSGRKVISIYTLWCAFGT